VSNLTYMPDFCYSTIGIRGLFCCGRAYVRLQLVYLSCLRISPPIHRTHPLAIRYPPSAIQSPSSFAFHEQPEDPDERFFSTSTPRRARYSRTHRRLKSSTEPGPSSSIFTPTNAKGDEYENEITLNSDPDLDPDADLNEYLESDSDVDSLSSISDSSIIDLPAPLSPSRIRPPTSISMPRALNIAALDRSPIVGPLIRRSRSARYLVGSLGGRSLGLEDNAIRRGRTVSAVPGTNDNYGTFGDDSV
jgi:hypothetical protein